MAIRRVLITPDVPATFTASPKPRGYKQGMRPRHGYVRRHDTRCRPEKSRGHRARLLTVTRRQQLQLKYQPVELDLLEYNPPRFYWLDYLDLPESDW